MAEFLGSVTIIWKLIVVLFVAGCVDVAVGGALTGTESIEEITELQTIVIELPEDDVSPSSPSQVGPSHPPLVQGEDHIDSIEVRFKLLDHKVKDTSAELENDVVEQILLALKNKPSNFTGAEFKAFRESADDGDLIADVEIFFADKLSDDSRKAEYDILLNLVEVEGTIGTLRVDGLKVKNDYGKIIAFTYCNITQNRCPTGANCVGNGTSCTANCNQNEAYCQNGGTCQDETIYISCICPEGVTGDRCGDGGAILTDAARVAIIAAAVVVSLLILLILLFCFVRKCRACTKPSRELYGVENVVALHSIRDEGGPVGGVAIQTDDSFLLNLSYANGVPPKAGYSHKIMQTNESFLLTRSQNPKVAQVKAQAHLRQSQNGSPSTSENSNGSRESKPSPQGGTSRAQHEDNSKVNAEGTQTGGSLPRRIIKV